MTIINMWNIKKINIYKTGYTQNRKCFKLKIVSNLK